MTLPQLVSRAASAVWRLVLDLAGRSRPDGEQDENELARWDDALR